MHWNCIVYDKHSCPMQSNSISNALELNCLCIDEQCIGIALFIISIVVQ